jgi:hypothetical protein
MAQCPNLAALNVKALPKTVLAASMTRLVAGGIIDFGAFNLNRYLHV